MKKYIELDAVNEVIKNKMKELHELRKEPGLLPKDAYTAMMVGVDEIREEIQSIPSICPEEIVKEMIAEHEPLYKGRLHMSYHRGAIVALTEFLNRIKS